MAESRPKRDAPPPGKKKAQARRPRAFKPPLLMEGGLSGAVYVVTVGLDHGDGNIVATTKWDVTEPFDALARKRGWIRREDLQPIRAVPDL